MKNRKRNLGLLALIIIFSLYLLDTSMAMAAPESIAIRDTAQNTETTISQNTAQDTSQNPVQDTVSTADGFIEWLESHKNGGGSVKLTNNIVLREFYYFTPNGANLPDIVVDTDIYTITAAGNIAFISDEHLIFRGKGGSKGIFHAIKGSMLTLDGVIVEGIAAGTSPQYTLWQEEGAGLLLGNTYAPCRVSGEIHYADKPFVTESSSVCVVVEKGQSADGSLPAQIQCKVNYQGQIQYNRMIQVSWDLAGTEKQQEERRRFRVEGISSQAFFQVPPVCTVVYNDYPLTFTRVDAFIRGNGYYFQGDYTKPQGQLPLTVTEEYSFDGTSWIESQKKTVTSEKEGFRIYFPCDNWDKAQNPYVYIRLRGEKDDTTYLSNVLRYAAYNMESAEDIGGSRGGGTSIVDPPDDPKEDSDDTTTDNRNPSQSTESGKNKDSDNKNSVNEAQDDSSDSETSSESNSSVVSQSDDQNTINPVDANTSLNSNVSENADGSNITITYIPEDSNGENTTAHTPSVLTEDENNSKDSNSAADEMVSKESVEAMSQELGAPASDGVGENVSKHRQITIKQRLNITRNIVLVSGFITLLAGAGVVGYFVHTGSLSRNKHKKSIHKEPIKKEIEHKIHKKKNPRSENHSLRCRRKG